MPSVSNAAELIKKNQVSLFLAVLGILFLYYYLFIFDSGSVPGAGLSSNENESTSSLLKKNSPRLPAKSSPKASSPENFMVDLDPSVEQLAGYLSREKSFILPREIFIKPSALPGSPAGKTGETDRLTGFAEEPQGRKVEISVAYIGFYSLDGDDFAVLRVGEAGGRTVPGRVIVKKGSLIPSRGIRVMGMDSTTLTLGTVGESSAIKINETGLVTYFEKM